MNQSYGRLVSRAAIAATAMASLLLLIKIFAWWYTGSVSILAALVDSLVDIGASLTNLLVVRYSLQPADDNHSFGHGKAESLAALAQSMFISGSALFLFLTGIQHLVSPTPMTDPGVGVIVTIVALICTIILVSFQRWVVRRTQSRAVRADMLHYQSDVMMNGAILLALGLSGTAGIAPMLCLHWESASIFYIARYAWDMRRYSHYWIAHYLMRNGKKLLIS